MNNIHSVADLKDAIRVLEIEQASKGQLLKEQFHHTYESLKPVNLLTSSLRDISSSPYLIENILSTAIGLATGYLAKKIVAGKSSNIPRKIFGLLLQVSASNLVAQNTEAIKKMGQLLYQKIFHKKETNSNIS
jgi:hypothetical protein